MTGDLIRRRLRGWNHEARSIVRGSRRLVALTGENDLLTFASAISYQILFALPAVLLAGLAVLGYADLRELWDGELAPRLEQMTSSSVFDIVSTTADEVMASRSGFWLTLGVLLALWYLSGAMRAVMGVMNGIYSVDETRAVFKRLLFSFVLTVAVTLCFTVALLAGYVSPAVTNQFEGGVPFTILASVVRWLLVLAPLYLALLLIVHHAPARAHRFRRGSLTAALVVGGWVMTSVGFQWYVTNLANYQSVFGNLASVMILMVYLNLSAGVLVFGLQIDAIVRGMDGSDADTS